MSSFFFSAFLLYLSFPNVFSFHGFGFLAWIFAISLFRGFAKKTFRQRLALGFVWGLLVYGLIVNWFVSYSIAGFLFFVFFLSLQSVVFAALFPPRLKNNFCESLYLASAWVVSESLRSLLMRGFSWDVGHSQIFNPVFLQAADLAGSAGLSFLILWVNYGLFQCLGRSDQRRLWVTTIGGVFLFLFLYGMGIRSWHEQQIQKIPRFEACVVQPDIDFHEKSDPKSLPDILDQNLKLSAECLRQGTADFILWPETAVPTDFRFDQILLNRILAFVQTAKTPLLLGAALEGEGKLYNGVFWISRYGQITDIYHKRYLVPFTEYMPGGVLGLVLEKILPTKAYEFSAGEKREAFHTSSQSAGSAGILICSEDTVASLFSEYRQKGAGLIVVLLNDGWFKHKEGLSVHGGQAVMHAVENRSPVLRVSNNGWSGFIDPVGHVDSGNLILQQAGAARIPFYFYQGKSFYPIFHQIFCVFCWGFVIIILIREYLSRKARQDD